MSAENEILKNEMLQKDKRHSTSKESQTKEIRDLKKQCLEKNKELGKLKEEMEALRRLTAQNSVVSQTRQQESQPKDQSKIPSVVLLPAEEVKKHIAENSAAHEPQQQEPQPEALPIVLPSESSLGCHTNSNAPITTQQVFEADALEKKSSATELGKELRRLAAATGKGTSGTLSGFLSQLVPEKRLEIIDEQGSASLKTALHRAAENADIRKIKILLKAGAKATITDKDKKTAWNLLQEILEKALRDGKNDVVQKCQNDLRDYPEIFADVPVELSHLKKRVDFSTMICSAQENIELLKENSQQFLDDKDPFYSLIPTTIALLEKKNSVKFKFLGNVILLLKNINTGDLHFLLLNTRKLIPSVILKQIRMVYEETTQVSLNLLTEAELQEYIENLQRLLQLIQEKDLSKFFFSSMEETFQYKNQIYMNLIFSCKIFIDKTDFSKKIRLDMLKHLDAIIAYGESSINGINKKSILIARMNKVCFRRKMVDFDITMRKEIVKEIQEIYDNYPSEVEKNLPVKKQLRNALESIKSKKYNPKKKSGSEAKVSAKDIKKIRANFHDRTSAICKQSPQMEEELKKFFSLSDYREEGLLDEEDQLDAEIEILLDVINQDNAKTTLAPSETTSSLAKSIQTVLHREEESKGLKGIPKNRIDQH